MYRQRPSVISQHITQDRNRKLTLSCPESCCQLVSYELPHWNSKGDDWAQHTKSYCKHLPKMSVEYKRPLFESNARFSDKNDQSHNVFKYSASGHRRGCLLISGQWHNYNS